MLLLLAALTQTISPVPSENIDVTIPRSCEAKKTATDEILVCAKRTDRSPYRITQPPPRQSRVPKAELQLADGVSASADIDGYDVGGFPSNRIMVRLKIKF